MPLALRPAALPMRPTVLESGRSFFRSAECAAASVLVHAGVAWLAVSLTQGGSQLPADEREARVFFLLPTDRVEVRAPQTEMFRLGRVGGDLGEGTRLVEPSEGRRIRAATHGTRVWGKEAGARGKPPFGPATALVPDTVFSVLEVDEMVERYVGSDAPVYPSDLAARGTQGMVQATYVVDTTGRVDTSTIEVLQSDHPRFTESVRTALDRMRFRPARRAGKPVRQLVRQKFRFQIAPGRPDG